MTFYAKYKLSIYKLNVLIISLHGNCNILLRTEYMNMYNNTSDHLLLQMGRAQLDSFLPQHNPLAFYT